MYVCMFVGLGPPNWYSTGPSYFLGAPINTQKTMLGIQLGSVSCKASECHILCALSVILVY